MHRSACRSRRRRAARASNSHAAPASMPPSAALAQLTRAGISINSYSVLFPRPPAPVFPFTLHHHMSAVRSWIYRAPPMHSWHASAASRSSLLFFICASCPPAPRGVMPLPATCRASLASRYIAQSLSLISAASGARRLPTATPCHRQSRTSAILYSCHHDSLRYI